MSNIKNFFFIKNKIQEIQYYNLFLKNKKFSIPKKLSIDLSKVTNNIFIINLKKDKDKKNEMEKKLTNYGINNYEFILGIIPENQYLELFENISKDEDHIGRINYVGELGCFLSHQKIWNKVINEDIENCLILEDDIFFHLKFQEILDKNINVFDTYDIVFLGANQSIFTNKIIQNIKNNYKENKNYYLSNHLIDEKNVFTYGTFSYFIKNKTIKLFLNEINNKDFRWRTIDTFIHNTIEKYKLKSCVFFPNLIISDVSKSSIREGRDLIPFAYGRKWNLPLYDFNFPN